MSNHELYMNNAYQEALKALDEGEVPVGAVVVHENHIIGRGYNRIESLQDATAHAEIIAIGAASNSLSTWRLNDCTLYVTLEPCMMCLGAILQCRIACVVYAVSDPRLGAIETTPYKNQAISAYNVFPDIVSSVMARECSLLLKSFFKNIRKKN